MKRTCLTFEIVTDSPWTQEAIIEAEEEFVRTYDGNLAVLWARMTGVEEIEVAEEDE